jgi:hypothetical protein
MERDGVGFGLWVEGFVWRESADLMLLVLTLLVVIACK